MGITAVCVCRALGKLGERDWNAVGLKDGQELLGQTERTDRVSRLDDRARAAFAARFVRVAVGGDFDELGKRRGKEGGLKRAACERELPVLCTEAHLR